MKKVKEIIVVEGKDDLNRIKEVYNATVISTNGFYIKRETIGLLKKTLLENEIIIFTDSDESGNIIREKLVKILGNNEKIKHAYLCRKNTEVEYANRNEIKKALKDVLTFYYDNQEQKLTLNELFILGFTGAESRSNREKIEKTFSLGKSTTKKFLERLNYFNIGFEKLKEELEKNNTPPEGLEPPT